jgi:hypothetical protein
MKRVELISHQDGKASQAPGLTTNRALCSVALDKVGPAGVIDNLGR